MPQVKIELTAQGSLLELPLSVALDKGLFKAARIDVKLAVIRPPAAVAALMTGSLQFMTALEDLAAVQGRPIRVVAVARDHPTQVMLGSKGMHGPSDLHGKRIVLGTSPKNGSVLWADQLLRQHGLPSGSYHPFFMSAPAALPLLAEGKVDAVWLNATTATLFASKGYPVVLNGGVLDYPSMGLTTSVQEIRAHPALVRRVLSAYVQALHMLAQQPALAAHEMETDKAYHLSPAQAKMVAGLLSGQWQVDGRAGAQAERNELNLDQQVLGRKRAASPSQVYDFSLLPSATS